MGNIINPYRFGGTTPSIIPLQNIISEYKFENDVLDTVGTNDGTPTAITYADGLVGRTGVFNNATSLVTILDTDDLSFGNGVTDSPFSVSLLINWNEEVPLPNSPQRLIVNKMFPSDDRFEYSIIRYDDAYLFYLYSNGSLVTYIRVYVVDYFMDIGTWYHLAVTYDGGGSEFGMKIYINGVDETTSQQQVGTYVAMTNDNRNIQIGGTIGLTTQVVDGNIDSVRFWDKELSYGEIITLAENELAGVDVNVLPPYITTNLVLDLDASDIASYPSTGITWFDLTANNNDGTITGATYVDNGDTDYFDFDGTGDSVALPSTFFKTDKILSVSVWVKFDTLSKAFEGIIENFVGNVGGWDMDIESSVDKLPRFFFWDGSSFTEVFGTTVLTTGVWYNLCVTISASQLKIYVNGNLEGTTAYTIPMDDTTQGVIIGGDGASTNYLDGKIGGARIYDRDLTLAEVEQNFNYDNQRYNV